MRSAAEALEHAVRALPPGSTSFAVLRIGFHDLRLGPTGLEDEIADSLLDILEQRLVSGVREHEGVLRLPNDEFVVLLQPAGSVVRAGAAADRLSALLHRPMRLAKERHEVSACIGVALSPEDGTDAAGLLQHAGSALAAAKLAGTGLVQFYEPAMENGRRQHHALALELRRALLQEQMEVHYQPQVDVRTHRTTGLEALLRWRHPRLGLLYPADFLPLAEETGQLGLLGDWVLSAACQQARQLPDGVTVAFNVAGVQFRNRAFEKSLERALAAAGVASNRLEIEVTEDLLLEAGDAILPALRWAADLGVRLVLDNFGTGNSSLGCLNKLPFSKVKVDRALLGGGARERSVVQAIASLGRGLGMVTLAVGVETERQLAEICEAGCDAAQGYLFGAAVPPGELHLQHSLSRPLEIAAAGA